MAALALTACVSSTVEEPEETVLRVMLADDWAAAPAVANAVTAFEADHPDVRVAVQGVPFAQIPDALRGAQEAGRPIDVVHWHAFALAELGMADEVGDLWQEHGVTEDEWIPGALQDVVWEGGTYGLPLDTNALVLLANGAALEEAGLRPEGLADPDGLRAALAALGEGERHGMAVSSSGWAAYGWIRAFGGELVHLDEDGVDITLDDPRAIEAIGYLGALVADGVAVPPTMRDVTRDAAALFSSELVAIHASGSWDVAATLSESYEGPEVAVLPLPRVSEDSGTALGGSSLSVVSGSPLRDLGFRFMLHLVEDEWVLRYAEEEGRLPARARVLEDEVFQVPPYRVVVSELPRASADRLIAFPAANQAFKDALEDVLLGRATAEEALTRAQAIADAELASRS